MKQPAALAMIFVVRSLSWSTAFSTRALGRRCKFSSTSILYRETDVEQENPFRVSADYDPAGDQPEAIDAVEKQLNSQKMSILQGATGTGKTFVMAHMIERRNQPCLVLAHNKLLAAQLARELKSFLKSNSVELFVSYYNHYVPESFKESTNTYVGKKSAISAEIDALRHCATRALLTRNDVVVVSSVSCIFGIGLPSEYLDSSLRISVHSTFHSMDFLAERIRTQMLYQEATDDEFNRGQFQVLDDGIMVWPPHDALPIHITLEPTTMALRVTSITQGASKSMPNVHIFPAKHHVISPERLEQACRRIQDELDDRRKELLEQDQPAAAERLSQRVVNDLFMLRETGTCPGIENYSRHMAGKPAGAAPTTLLDYFNKNNDWWLIVDESHVTIPQLSAMYNGDQRRKEALVKHGYRLPSALDNRPLAFAEFWSKVDTTLFVSATPGTVERGWCAEPPVEMAIRPTFVPDPTIVVQPKKDQLDQLTKIIRENTTGRTLSLVLTKVDAEDLSTHLNKKGIRAGYLHSGMTTQERSDVLKKLQGGIIDCLVGVNCLREGLDLPQVSVVAVLDADVQGFLRSETALLQMIGRAARNMDGKAVFFANRISPAMKACMEATEKRRSKQLRYNAQHGVTMRSTKGSSVLSIFDLAQEQIQQELENNSLREAPRSVKTIKDSKGKIATEHIPSAPGVYFWKDGRGKILYIGKAIKLRSRIRSYQSSKEKHSKRIQVMIEKASSVDFILTPSERDALVLESNMIKYHQPSFNVLLKDDEHYPFLHATNGDVPILTIVPRKTSDSGGRFFGPYTNFKEIHTILDGIEATYDLRGQAFLARHGSLPKDTYRELFDKVIEEVFDRVSELSSLSKLREEYQHAGLLFDSEYNRSRDVVAVAQVQHPNRKHKLIVHVVQLREGVVAGQYSYNCELSRIDDQVDDADFAEAIQAVLLKKHYPAGARESQSDRFSWIPESILVPIALSKQSSIEAYLEKPVSIKIAAKSGPRKAVDMRVAEFASQNANQAAAVEFKKENDITFSNDVGKLLDLEQPLRRIECYDISHMNGEYSVASRVVFLNGKPAPKLYRKFNIKSVDGIDDYASMKEVLYRRFLRLEEPGDSWSMPDLVVIDGGPGQLNAAIEGILDAGVGHVPTCALAKKHEHVFVPGRQDPVNDAADSPGVILLRAIRDESHRFAVKSHRSRRSLVMNQQST